MHAGAAPADVLSRARPLARERGLPDASLPSLEPCAPRELSALVHAGENDSDAVERLLVRLARLEGALDLAIGDGLAALTEGSRLIALGFSCLEDYAREVLDVKERKAQAMARLSRALRGRPVLRAAVMAGEVRIRIRVGSALAHIDQQREQPLRERWAVIGRRVDQM